MLCRLGRPVVTLCASCCSTCPSRGTAGPSVRPIMDSTFFSWCYLPANDAASPFGLFLFSVTIVCLKFHSEEVSLTLFRFPLNSSRVSFESIRHCIFVGRLPILSRKAEREVPFDKAWAVRFILRFLYIQISSEIVRYVFFANARIKFYCFSLGFYLTKPYLLAH